MMKSKEDVLEIIANAKTEGITLTKIADSKKKKDTAPIKDMLATLLSENKITKSGSRYYLRGIRKQRKRKAENYITREELEGIIGEVYKDIAHLKDRIDRAYEYVDEVFLNLRDRNKNESGFPSKTDMLLAYDNINRTENAGESVPISDFKKELRKMGFKFNEEEINKKLLEMDKTEIIYLQQANDPDELENKKEGIQTGRGFLFYITWIKRS
ncbi:MAG: hypothetical protein GWP10_11275 [Nitrospiraceae bacterium]|nr:hypothetical protein [Nitrospiraceae bacterium]